MEDMEQGREPDLDIDGGSVVDAPSMGADGVEPSAPDVGSHHLPPLTVLKGRYLLKGVLGEGGFGITYDGQDQLLGNRVAVKEYFPQGHVIRDTSHSLEVTDLAVGDDTSFQRGKERFRDEARIMGRVGKAPALCSVVDFFEEFNTAYIVMEYVEGTSLGAYLEARGNIMGFDDLMVLMVPIMRALGLMHEAGLVHRDVSPDNIMVGTYGAILIDFGCAREFIADDDAQQTMTVMLKYDYAAPEQYGRSGQGPWTDVYGICAVLYRALTGTPPLRVTDRLAGDKLIPPKTLAPSLPSWAARTIVDGLSLNFRDRPQTMAELEGRLVSGKRRRLPTAPVAAALVAALGVAAIGGVLWQSRGSATSETVAQEQDGNSGTSDLLEGAEATPDGGSQTKAEDDAGETSTTGVAYRLSGALSAGGFHTVAIVDGKTVEACGSDEFSQCAGMRDAEGVVQVAAGTYHTACLKSDGTVMACGDNSYGQCDTDAWHDVVSVSSGMGHTVGLTAEGRVLAAGSDEYGQDKVASWMGVSAISAGFAHTLGLTDDGHVLAVGDNVDGELDVDSWHDIVDIAAGGLFSVGLKSDGTVVAVGNNEFDQLDVDGWKHITHISAGACHVVGLTADGHVVASGLNEDGQCDVENWSDVVLVSAGGYHTVAVRRDGTLLATGRADDGQCEVSGWTLEVTDDGDEEKA